MSNTRPGDLVYVSQGAYMRSIINNGLCRNESIVQALVIGSGPHQFVNPDTGFSSSAAVFISGIGLYFVEELNLMTPDEYSNPARLFPPTRAQKQ